MFVKGTKQCQVLLCWLWKFELVVGSQDVLYNGQCKAFRRGTWYSERGVNDMGQRGCTGSVCSHVIEVVVAVRKKETHCGIMGAGRGSGWEVGPDDMGQAQQKEIQN